MKLEASGSGTAKALKAEFDSLADEYHEQHRANIAITGETPEYFAEYKIADLAAFANKNGLVQSAVLDFGSGIGNSIPFFRKYFGRSKLLCADVSGRSIEISQTRFPDETEEYVLLDDHIPLQDDSVDIVFSACVFHHIDHGDHVRWLSELRRVTRVGGLLAIYEHNPLNPLTLHAVNTCPFDKNARLIRGGKMRRRATEAGWTEGSVNYKIFFPSALSSLRRFESALGWCALGAQYRMTARNGKR